MVWSIVQENAMKNAPIANILMDRVVNPVQLPARTVSPGLIIVFLANPADILSMGNALVSALFLSLMESAHKHALQPHI